jgi:hypothetical protein
VGIFVFLTDMNGYCCVGLPLYMHGYIQQTWNGQLVNYDGLGFFFLISYELDLKF